tara:strand:- start:12041 stop:13039 length:999 start_codon:yes stop_codon:yes gene_type:complete
VILKSYIVEKNLNTLKEYRATLLYGVNDGFKDDIKTQLKNLNKDAEIINFFESEITKNENVLYENIFNESLFNSKKIIFIQLATDKIFNEVYETINKNTNTELYIFAENLDKKSKLRNLFDKEKNLAAIPCYEDNERTLINYIRNELSEFKGLTGELTNIILTNSNANRRTIKNELIKIKDFFVKKLIVKKQLLEILNIKSDSNFDEIRDNALVGRKDKINKLLTEIELLRESSFFYLNSLNYRIFKLIEIQKKNIILNNHEKTIENLSPPIFWKDKEIYLTQLKKWNLEKLYKAVFKISEAEDLMKKNSHIKNDVVIKNLILYLLEEASVS